MSKVNESVICAGFGGQGIMVMGKVLANSALKKGYGVTWMPSYGAEVRGGTAHAMVKVSEDYIASPVVSEADTVFIMSGPSLAKFEKRVKKNGFMVLNTSMVKGSAKRSDIEIAKVPVTDEAISLGNAKVANMIAIGVYVARKKLFDKKVVQKVIKDMAMGRKELISINIDALDRGMELGKR